MPDDVPVMRTVGIHPPFVGPQPKSATARKGRRC
jgi:hypothetical protein